MTEQHDTMMSPTIEDLLGRTDSKFRLVTLGALRACQINSYFGQLGEGLGAMVPPQVLTVSRKSCRCSPKAQPGSWGAPRSTPWPPSRPA